MQSFFRNILIAAALLAVPLAGTAQNAAAFLSVVPDARSAAMGGAGKEDAKLRRRLGK